MFKKRRTIDSLRYPATRPYESPTGTRRRRSIPDNVRRYFVPLSVMEATDRLMRKFGLEERECYVWWGGYFTSEGEGQVLTALCPDIPSSYGRIHLRTPELIALHNRLREIDQVLLAELHTHPPGAGGQNEVDASYPAATYPGFISIVVPDFAVPRFYDLRESYVYEYQGSGSWRELGRDEIVARFVIEETFFSVEI